MTTRLDVSRRMLALEAIGFLLIVAIIWMEELLDLPHLRRSGPNSGTLGRGNQVHDLNTALQAVRAFWTNGRFEGPLVWLEM